MKTKIKRITCAALLTVAISSCTTYTLDPQAPHAKIVTKDYNFLDNQNEILITDDYSACKSFSALHSYGIPVDINANHPVTLMVLNQIGYTTLIYPFTFTPKANHTYSIETKKQKTKDAINVTLYLLDDNGKPASKLTLTPFIVREYQSGALSVSCLDKNKDLTKAPAVTSLVKTAYRI